jgi:hypothetical protein
MMQRVAAAVLLLAARIANADVIFPAFMAPYASALLLPVALIAILVSEAVVYRIAWRHLSIGIVVLLDICANLVSSVVGMVIASFLPSGLMLDPKNHMVQGGGQTSIGMRSWVSYLLTSSAFVSRAPS